MEWIALAMFAIQLGVTIYDALAQSQRIQQEHDYNQTNLEIQHQQEVTNIQQQYYNTEAEINTVEDKVVDAFTNMKILLNNIDVIKKNADIKLNQLYEQDQKQRGAIFSSGYSNGFMLSDIQKEVMERNSLGIKADMQTVEQEEETKIADTKTQIENLESFVKKYYGEDAYNSILQQVGDVNKDNKTDVMDLEGLDISKIDFTGADGYLAELKNRLDQYNQQLGGIMSSEGKQNGIVLIDSSTGERIKLGTKIPDDRIQLGDIRDPISGEIIKKGTKKKKSPKAKINLAPKINWSPFGAPPTIKMIGF